MSTLFEITNEFERLYQLATDEEIDEEAFLGTLESLNADLELKSEGYANVIQQLQMEADKAEQLEKEFKHKKEVRQRRIAAMKDAIKQAMITADLKQVDAGKFTIKLMKNGVLEPLIIDKPEEVPDNMKVIKYENDTKRIREYLADHPADWAHTEPRGSHIEIK
jgi:hypothetical protein